MAYQNVGPIPCPLWPTGVNAAPSYTSLLIDAVGEKVGFVVPGGIFGQAIRKILWRTGTVTTGDTVDVRVETVDATTGDPTGTLVGTNTNAAQVVGSGDDAVMFTTTLTADADVSALVDFAVVIANGAGGGNMNIVYFDDEFTTYPYCDLLAGAGPSWTKTGAGPVLGFELADGTYVYVPGCWPMSGITTTAYGSGSTPDVMANRFSLLVPSKVTGWWAWVATGGGDYTVKLYGSDGVTVLASSAMDAQIRSAGSRIMVRPFGAPSAAITLLANTNYWIGLEPSSATTISAYDFTVPAAAVMDSFPFGQTVLLSTAKDPSGTGSWTTTSTRRLFAGVMLSAFSDGVGGGSSAAIFGG